MDNSFFALGLMSGTSLDGIDASVIKSDGEDNLDIIDNKYLKYPEEFKRKLSRFIQNINNKEDIEKTEPVFASSEEKIEENVPEDINLSINEKEEFSAEETETSEIDDEFNQETEEELLDKPTFLRSQAN